MTKKIILLILFCFFTNPCFAIIQDSYPFVSTVEQRLFGTKFQSENITKRLNRIEINVFGLKTAGSTQVRINKLKTIFGQIEKPSIPAKKAQNKQAQKIVPVKKINKEDSNIKYTVVDELEKKILNHTFSNDNIYRRLSRLETVVFSRTINAPLSERVDNLKNTVYGNNKPNNNQIAQNNSPELSDESVNLLLNKMETDTLNQTYPNDSVDARLSRLEMQLFNSASPEDPVNDRIERLSAVIAAKPTNELYKDMSMVRQYQDLTTKISAAAILLLIIKGMLF